MTTPQGNTEGHGVLGVGTEVSARFKGAYCEAVITKVDTALELRVNFQIKAKGSHLICDKDVNGTVRLHGEVEAKHPSDGMYYPATIVKITDNSVYTVVYDDGDIGTLRRAGLRPKGMKHFIHEATIDLLPLTDPDKFALAPGARRESHSNTKIGNKNKKLNRATSGPTKSRKSNVFAPTNGKKTLKGGTNSTNGNQEWGLKRGAYFVESLGSAMWRPAVMVPDDEIDKTMPAKSDPNYCIVRYFDDLTYCCIPETSLRPFSRDAPLFKLFVKDDRKTFLENPGVVAALAYIDHMHTPTGFMWGQFERKEPAERARAQAHAYKESQTSTLTLPSQTAAKKLCKTTPHSHTIPRKLDKGSPPLTVDGKDKTPSSHAETTDISLEDKPNQPSPSTSPCAPSTNGNTSDVLATLSPPLTSSPIGFISSTGKDNEPEVVVGAGKTTIGPGFKLSNHNQHRDHPSGQDDNADTPPIIMPDTCAHILNNDGNNKNKRTRRVANESDEEFVPLSRQPRAKRHGGATSEHDNQRIEEGERGMREGEEGTEGEEEERNTRTFRIRYARGGSEGGRKKDINAKLTQTQSHTLPHKHEPIGAWGNGTSEGSEPSEDAVCANKANHNGSNSGNSSNETRKPNRRCKISRGDNDYSTTNPPEPTYEHQGWMFNVGERVWAMSYLDGKIYQAKVMKREMMSTSRDRRGATRSTNCSAANFRTIPQPHYCIHYMGWGDRYAEWIEETQVFHDDPSAGMSLTNRKRAGGHVDAVFALGKSPKRRCTSHGILSEEMSEGDEVEKKNIHTGLGLRPATARGERQCEYRHRNREREKERERERESQVEEEKERSVERDNRRRKRAERKERSRAAKKESYSSVYTTEHKATSSKRKGRRRHGGKHRRESSSATSHMPMASGLAGVEHDHLTEPLQPLGDTIKLEAGIDSKQDYRERDREREGEELCDPPDYTNPITTTTTTIKVDYEAIHAIDSQHGPTNEGQSEEVPANDNKRNVLSIRHVNAPYKGRRGSVKDKRRQPLPKHRQVDQSALIVSADADLSEGEEGNSNKQSKADPSLEAKGDDDIIDVALAQSHTTEHHHEMTDDDCDSSTRSFISAGTTNHHEATVPVGGEGAPTTSPSCTSHMTLTSCRARIGEAMSPVYPPPLAQCLFDSPPSPIPQPSGLSESTCKAVVVQSPASSYLPPVSVSDLLPVKHEGPITITDPIDPHLDKLNMAIAVPLVNSKECSRPINASHSRDPVAYKDSPAIGPKREGMFDNPPIESPCTKGLDHDIIGKTSTDYSVNQSQLDDTDGKADKDVAMETYSRSHPLDTSFPPSPGLPSFSSTAPIYPISASSSSPLTKPIHQSPYQDPAGEDHDNQPNPSSYDNDQSSMNKKDLDEAGLAAEALTALSHMSLVEMEGKADMTNPDPASPNLFLTNHTIQSHPTPTMASTNGNERHVHTHNHHYHHHTHHYHHRRDSSTNDMTPCTEETNKRTTRSPASEGVANNTSGEDRKSDVISTDEANGKSSEGHKVSDDSEVVVVDVVETPSSPFRPTPTPKPSRYTSSYEPESKKGLLTLLSVEPSDNIRHRTISEDIAECEEAGRLAALAALREGSSHPASPLGPVRRRMERTRSGTVKGNALLQRRGERGEGASAGMANENGDRDAGTSTNTSRLSGKRVRSTNHNHIDVGNESQSTVCTVYTTRTHKQSLEGGVTVTKKEFRVTHKLDKNGVTVSDEQLQEVKHIRENRTTNQRTTNRVLSWSKTSPVPIEELENRMNDLRRQYMKHKLELARLDKMMKRRRYRSHSNHSQYLPSHNHTPDRDRSRDNDRDESVIGGATSDDVGMSTYTTTTTTTDLAVGPTKLQQ